MLVNLDVYLDELNISKSIVKGFQANTRAKFVKNLRDKTFEAGEKRYNVMIFHLGNNHEQHFNEIVFFATTVYKVRFISVEVTYGIWAFKSGEFRNLGDGGYINWAYRGCWKNSYDEGRVRFFPPG